MIVARSLDLPSRWNLVAVGAALFGFCASLQRTVRQLPRSSKSLLGHAALHVDSHVLGHTLPHLHFGLHTEVCDMMHSAGEIRVWKFKSFCLQVRHQILVRRVSAVSGSALVARAATIAAA